MNHQSRRDLVSRNLTMFPILAAEIFPRVELPESSRRANGSSPLNISAPHFYPKSGIIDSPSSASQWVPSLGECRSMYYPPYDHLRFNPYGVPPMLSSPNLHCPPPFPWFPHQHNPHRMEFSQWLPFIDIDSEIGRFGPRFPRPDSLESYSVRGSPVRIRPPAEYPSAHDNHRELRLDVDNMSYEELLALEERMGSVSIGVEEEKFGKLVRKTVCCSDGESKELCCVCQEDVEDGDDIGVLDCRHGFHVDCIYRWLKVKNFCPICKKSALVS